MDTRIIITEKYSRILRYTHWINFVLLTLMTWSGVLIYWANDIYIKIPSKLAETLSLRFRLAEGLGWHFFIMWFFTFNGLIYFLHLLTSGEWRELSINFKTFPEAVRVILHDLKLSKREPIQKGKFNAAQRIAYCSAIAMAFGSILTGLAIYKPVTLGWLTEFLGGYEAARLEHFLLMIGFVLFFIIHIIQVIRSGWNNFRAMVAGYEIKK